MAKVTNSRLISNTPSPVNDADNFPKEIEEVRVVDVILNSWHQNFQWIEDIGNIFFENIDMIDASGLIPFKARPLFPFIKNYPLKNEIVIIISLATKDLSRTQAYYITSLNLWNSSHHNAVPTEVDMRKDEGRGNITVETFEDKGEVPLQPYEGDIILEGIRIMVQT